MFCIRRTLMLVTRQNLLNIFLRLLGGVIFIFVFFMFLLKVIR